jgi:hypothetical protein
MFAAYLFCLLAGGALVGAAAIFGGKELEVGGHDVGGHGGDADGAHATGWLPFMSFQFWTFALAFFGLTGTVLTLLDLASTVPTLLTSLVLGLSTGTGVSMAVRKLRTQHVSSSIGSGDIVGKSAIVRLPLGAGSAGKIRLSVKAQVIDLVATTDDKDEIATGEEVLVTEMVDGRAVVVRAVRVEQSTAPEAETLPASPAPTRPDGQEGQ